MIRVTQVDATEPGADMVRLRVEGRLTAASIEAVRSEAALVLNRERSLVVDLFGVHFVDVAAAAVLRQLESQGAVLVGASDFVVAVMRKAPAAPSKANEERTEHSSERPLLARLRGHEAEAYEEMVRRYGGRMHATAQRLLRNEDDARDAVQDAFLSAFKGLSSFAGDSQLSTWLHRITVNAALMKLRKRGRTPEQPIDDLLPQFDEQGHWAIDEHPWEIPGEEAMARRETRAMVRACIDELPESYRTALMLRDIEDLDNDEVAAALGISANAAKIRVHRARQALRTLLARSFAEPPPLA